MSPVPAPEPVDPDGGGGGTSVVSFDFAHDTPGLTAGVTVWTPAVGDVLLDAWFVVTETFNGTTPKADIGTFVGVATGICAAALEAADCSGADADGLAGTGFILGIVPRSVSTKTIAGNPTTPTTWQITFTATNPLKLVVSRNGEAGGTAIGGTTGAGTLYLLVATPTAA